MSLPLLHAGRTNPGLSAALDLRFALDKSLTAYRGPTPSFSRASTGTYFNSSGVLTSAAINAPRFDHTYNGTSWVSKGLLVEEQRTNIITYSEQFNNTAWTANGLNADVSTNLITAPDGAQTADKLFETNVNGGHYLNQTASITTGNSYTSTIYVKKENRSWLQIAYNSAAFGVNAWANFDVNNGVVGNKGSSATANITSVGSGWYRCSITATSTATATSGPVICLLDTDVNSRLPSYLGDGSSGLYIWGAQLEAGAFPTSYIGTTSASTTRSADVCQITGSDFSGFWNGTEGSLAFDADGFSTTIDNQFITSVSGGSVSNSINLVRSNANDVTGVGSSVLAGGVLQEAMNAAAGTWPTGLSCKLTFAYKANDFAQSVNGAAVTTDTSGSIPTVSQMVIGNAGWTTGPLNGHIARLRYYRTRLENGTLRVLST